MFSIATLMVLTWVSAQLLHTQRAMNAEQAEFQSAIADLRAELADALAQTESNSHELMSRLDKLTADKLKLASAKAPIAQKPKKVKKQQEVQKNQQVVKMMEAEPLKNAYDTVLKADLAASEKQGTEAAKLLESTKTAIWKTSEKWENSKDELRDLMAPIDILAAKWNRGDYSGNSETIQKVLLEVLEKQSQP